jgi:deoxyribodipyrimidine photolyase-related protein
MPSARSLILILDDQLTRDAASLQDADPERDVVVLGELDEEARRLPFHKQRLALIWSAMRHFRNDLRDRGWAVDYTQIDDADAPTSYPALLDQALARHQPERIVTMRPHDHRLLGEIRGAAETAGVPLLMQEDDHFLVTPDDFATWAEGHKRLTMEYFYREMRREYGVLLTESGDPEGGDWNFDEENRERFGRDGPGRIKAPIQFRPDAVTREVMETVEEHFPDHPGRLDDFNYPVTHAEAQRAVRDFVEHRLPTFGTYQDAMWTGRPFLYHSRLSAALNLHLLDPRYVIQKAERAYYDGHAPINAVEGFIRQILGWREYIRGVYWLQMPDYYDLNALDADRALPEFFWTGETDMTCVSQVIDQLLNTAYAHHIQRLMVTGLFAQLYGTRPQALHEWHMALYADAWEWVSLPNTVGMSQYGDGGIVGTKPYVATGKYINRMSNYCAHCRYDPDEATGDDACPFTTLYWDFLMRHEDTLDDNRRMNFQMHNLRRKAADEREAIATHAEGLRETMHA